MPTIEYGKSLEEKIKKLLEYKKIKYKRELLELLINKELEKMKGDRLDKLEFMLEQLASRIGNVESEIKSIREKI